MSKKLVGLVMFGVAFGFVEAAVVYYLRQVLGLSDNSGAANSAFIGSLLWRIEVFREAATIFMLMGVSLAASNTWREKLGSFLITFSLWDLFYYVFLKALSGWPPNLLVQDVYFLIPIPWVGPVIIPVIIFTLLLLVGIGLYRPKSRG